MTTGAHRSLGWRGWRKHGAVVLVITLVVILLHHAGWFTSLETAALDSFFALNQQPQRSQNVVLIVITDADYETLFHATSPLNVEILQRLLAALAIARPQVIGVDLDTSAPVWRGYRLPPGSPPIVWAREATIEHGHAELHSVLGEQQPSGARWGVALAPLDPDGVIRRYRWSFSANEGVVPSFAAAILAVRRAEGVPGLTGDTKPNFFGNRYDFDRYAASEVLRLAESEEWQAFLASRIVLLGATFRQSRDQYRAPWDGTDRRWYGVEVMANVIETELRGQGIRPVAKLWMILLDLLAGLTIVWLNHRFSAGWALCLSVLLAAVAAPVSSFLVFSSLAYWGSFAPVTAGIIIHQAYDHFKGNRETAHENNAETSP